MRTILSVDDDPQVLQCMELVLKKKGYQVFATTDPKEVSKIIKEHELDLVMLDVHMPKKNGFEVFQELKKSCQQLPVLFVTAYPKSFTMTSQKIMEMWKNDFADGNTDILYKPFEIDALYEKIESLIGKANEAEEEA